MATTDYSAVEARYDETISRARVGTGSSDELNVDDIKDPVHSEVQIEINGGDYFEWKNVNVTIKGKRILHNISGRVGSGQLLGILGGSGAGKTTLLNAISGRILSERPSTLSSLCCFEQFKQLGTQVTGSVGYKESEFTLGNSDEIKYLSAYVLQNDIMCPTATCEEALTFSSKLRSDPIERPLDKQLEIIDNVMTSLKLTDCKSTRVGNDAIRGMSGGEKKRTSVGVELVVEPSLIFLDEPTSGLDSFTALKTLDILKNLTSKQGKQVIATIHQPSSEIFEMLDILVLLAKGHVVYYGPRKDVINYFDRLGYQCPQYTNIADYVVNRVQENSEFFIEKWKEYEKEYIKLDFKSYDTLYPTKQQNSGFFMQCRELLKREAQIVLRDPRSSKIRFAQTVAFALLTGALYWQLPYDPEGLRNRFGAVFFLTVNSSMTGLASTIIVFPEQRLLFERERDANMYYTTTYLISKFLVQLPETALFTLIYQAICYWMVGFDSTFFELYMTLILCQLSVGSVGLIVGCFANSAAQAMQMMPAAFVPFILFTNFLVSLNQIPVWIRWLQWVDPFKFVVDCLAITEYHNQLHPSGCDPSPDATVNRCIYNGNAYLEELDVGYENTWLVQDYINSWMDSAYFDWIMLGVLTIGFRFIVWLILVRRSGF